MLAIYNGKEYVCRDYSFTGDGWYTKMVYGEECTGSSSHYSEEFVDVILGGQEGRDVYSWRKLDAFTGFHFLVYDYVETENPRYINERIIPVTKDEAEQYLKLAESEWKK